MAEAKNIIGHKFGNFTVIKQTETITYHDKREHNIRIFLLKCDCGNYEKLPETVFRWPNNVNYQGKCRQCLVGNCIICGKKLSEDSKRTRRLCSYDCAKEFQYRNIEKEKVKLKIKDKVRACYCYIDKQGLHKKNKFNKLCDGVICFATIRDRDSFVKNNENVYKLVRQQITRKEQRNAKIRLYHNIVKLLNDECNYFIFNGYKIEHKEIVKKINMGIADVMQIKELSLKG